LTGFRQKLQHRIQRIIEGRDQGRWPGTAGFLKGLSVGFGLISKTRIRLYDHHLLKSHRLPCHVIAVGNVTTGGTGKTPMTMYIARRMQQLGCRVVVLSRGYGGGAERTGGWVSDDRRVLMDPESAGDEPYMMAVKLPGIPIRVGQDRYRSGLDAIRRFKPDLIVLDDAFQHLGVQRDLNLLLLDAQRPFGNGYLLPRGPLRMPMTSIRRADAVVFTRCKNDSHESSLPLDTVVPIPVYHSRHVPALFKMIPSSGGDVSVALTLEPFSQAACRGAAVFGFSGIADNEDFMRSLPGLGFEVTGFIGFDDHHRYCRDDFERVRKAAGDTKAQWLITTEKDFYRVCHRLTPSIPMIVVGVEIELIPGRACFDDLLQRFAREQPRPCGERIKR
jgi:tetraacyldisaccharide 4'-kinase